MPSRPRTTQARDMRALPASGGMLLAPFFFLWACGDPDTSRRGLLTKQSSTVQGGNLASSQTFAVAMMGRGFRSGTLIAPNIVLTARHCVEVRPSMSSNGCEDDELVDASDLTVSTAERFPGEIMGEGKWMGRRVLAAPRIDDCSPDVAL